MKDAGLPDNKLENISCDELDKIRTYDIETMTKDMVDRVIDERISEEQESIDNNDSTKTYDSKESPSIEEETCKSRNLD